MNTYFGHDLFSSHQLAVLRGGDPRRPLADPGAHPMAAGYLMPSDFYGMPFPAAVRVMAPPLQYQHPMPIGDPHSFAGVARNNGPLDFFASGAAAPSPFNYDPASPKKKTPMDYGVLPPCDQPKELYSRKVFVGGLPIDITEDEVIRVFGVFGHVVVDWPRRTDKEEVSAGRSMTGYVFLVFENEASVSRLLSACHHDSSRYYLFVTSRTMKDKPVQVRPWLLSDADYMLDETLPVDGRRTVFIGGVPRPSKAKDLADSLCHLYGPVSYVGIDIDPELKYPKGAARVTFATPRGYIAAITGRFVYVSHAESEKRVEIKPYLMEDQMCDECQGKSCSYRYASYFCGDPLCLQYYCESCWDHVHYFLSDKFHHHCPMVRQGDQTKILQRPPHHARNHHNHRNYPRPHFPRS